MEDANAGIFVEPENARDFAEKVKWMIANSDQTRQLGENGYAFARKNMDRKILALKYLEKLKEVAMT